MVKELIGQFLIRRGMVRQSDIEDALVLQEILHDGLGAAALANDLVTFMDVGKILEYMDTHQIGFSDAAVRLKILDSRQVSELEAKAADCKFRLGQLLVATTKLTQDDLERELLEFSASRMLVPSPNVTKAELIKGLASNTRADSETAGAVLGALLQSISETLARGENIVLKGFGTFSCTRQGGRKGRNPRSGESITIGPRRRVQLRFAKKFRRLVDKGRS